MSFDKDDQLERDGAYDEVWNWDPEATKAAVLGEIAARDYCTANKNPVCPYPSSSRLSKIWHAAWADYTEGM